jgi:prophage regulatory protein
MAATTLSRASIYRMISEGKFPKQHQISDRRSVWLKSDIEKWMQKQMGENNADT